VGFTSTTAPLATVARIVWPEGTHWVATALGEKMRPGNHEVGFMLVLAGGAHGRNTHVGFITLLAVVISNHHATFIVGSASGIVTTFVVGSFHSAHRSFLYRVLMPCSMMGLLSAHHLAGFSGELRILASTKT
jgi:hypothetical protein